MTSADPLRAKAERVLHEAVTDAHVDFGELSDALLLDALASKPAFLAWAVREACDQVPVIDPDDDTDYVMWSPRPDVAALLEGE